MTDAAEMLEQYLAAGIGVFPLHTIKGGSCTCRRDCGLSAAKHPVLGVAHRKDDPRRTTCRGECGREGHGVHDATTDAGKVGEWLARYPGCNWAIRPPLGAVVLDIDPRNGGDESLAALQRKHHPLPETLTARTGSGGLHIWLSYTGPSRGKLAAGIDVKTHSGYLVAPPSLHACGGTYEWLDQRPAAYAPQWVKEILNPPVRRRAPMGPRGDGKLGRGLVAFVAALPIGQINDGLYWAACRAADAGVLDDVEEDLLAAAAHAAGGQASESGAAQSRKTIGSARRRPAGRTTTRAAATADFLSTKATG